MQSNTKIYLYVIKLTVVIAAVLSVLYTSLNPLFLLNKEKAKKTQILNCIPDQQSSVADIASVYDEKVLTILLDAKGTVLFEQKEAGKQDDNPDAKAVLAKLNERGLGVKYAKLVDVDLSSEEKFPLEKRVYPIYKYVADGGKSYYVTSVRGNGLWDKIWGYIALEKKDNNWLIAGVNFDHKNETPGLGAEIKDSKDFKDQFKEKQIFDAAGNYVSVAVLKKGIKHPEYQVKAISGATVTSVGVSDMLHKGIGYYLPYLESLK